ncbi:MAG TPA: hypothetical protein VGK89_08090 [Candidatus Eisenbacteria bacterium]|jgi:hypothetical protein
MASDPAPLSAEDEALLDRLATRVVELHMEVPAVLALESGRPLSVLASQSMIFFEPVVRALFHLPDYRRFAALIERREVLERLTARIEARADEAHRARRDAARARRAARSRRA